MRGQYAPLPTAVIAEALADLLPVSQTVVIDGAGHMGPLTHAAAVSAWLVQHIAAVDRACRRPHLVAPDWRAMFMPESYGCPS